MGEVKVTMPKVLKVRDWRGLVGCLGMLALVACNNEEGPARPAKKKRTKAKHPAAAAAVANYFSATGRFRSEKLVAVDDEWDPYCGDVSAKRAPLTFYIAPRGSDKAQGTREKPLATLDGAQQKLTDLANHDYVIIVRGGEYRGQTVTWTHTAPGAHVHIRAADGEIPIFDGMLTGTTKSRRATLFHLAPASSEEKTNLTLEGLTIRNYIQSGIDWRGECGRIFNNKLYNIGDAVGDCRAPAAAEGKPTDGKWIINQPSAKCEASDPACCSKADGDCYCLGIAAINLLGASHNLLEHNDVIDAVNQIKPKEIEGISLAEDANRLRSTFNLIEHNYVRNSTGPGSKAREGSGQNFFANNYWERVAYYCVLDIGHKKSFQNSLSGNVCNFWSGHRVDARSLTTPAGSTELSTSTRFFFAAPGGVSGDGAARGDTEQGSPDYFQPINNPADAENATVEEVVTATASADVDGDGKAEVFVALYYPKLHYSKVVYSDGKQRELRNVAFASAAWQVSALTAIREPGSPKAQIVSALYQAEKDQTRIQVGKVAGGQYRLNAGSLLHESTGPKGWKVTALTAGNFTGDEADELVVAAVVDGVNQIQRGDGRTAQSGDAMPGVSGTLLYSSTTQHVVALTHGVFAGAKESIVTVLRAPGPEAKVAPSGVYMGDGVSTAADKQVFDSKSGPVLGLTVAKVGGQVRLITIIDEGTTRVYAGSPSSVTAKRLYDAKDWRVTSLTAAAMDDDADDELVAGFDQPDKTQVRWGNGSKLDDGGILYSFP